MNLKTLYCIVLTILCIGPGWLHSSTAPGKEVLCEKEASSLAVAGRIDDAIDAITTCIDKNPEKAKAHVVYGYLLLEKGDGAAAEKSFDKALELRPMSSAAKTGKGIVLSRNGDLEAARTILENALKLNPDPARTYYELGLIHEQLGDAKGAVSYFKQGIDAMEQEGK